MLKQLITLIIGLASLLSINQTGHTREQFSQYALSAQDTDKQLATAADILAKTQLWQKSAFFVLVPDLEIVTLGIGGVFGRGILVAHHETAWGNPVFVRIATGQVETANNPTAILFIFKQQENLDTIFEQGRIEATQAQVYAYDGEDFSKISLTGLVNVEVNLASNTNFYGQPIKDPTKILSGKISANSKSLMALITVLD